MVVSRDLGEERVRWSCSIVSGEIAECDKAAHVSRSELRAGHELVQADVTMLICKRQRPVQLRQQGAGSNRSEKHRHRQRSDCRTDQINNSRNVDVSAAVDQTEQHSCLSTARICR